MKNCPNCGASNSDDSRFCKHCGSSLEETRMLVTDDNNTTVNNNYKNASLQSNFLRRLKDVNIIKNFKIICTGVVAASVIYAGNAAFGMFDNTAAAVKDSISAKSVNITNVILREKSGIQELAVAKQNYSVEKNNLSTQGLLFFDHVTQKFICDFHYLVKYGYDLTKLSSNDISEYKENKVIKVRLPKGKLISNELSNTNVRHNEGILLDINKVKAEDVAKMQSEAKDEVAKRAMADQELIKLAQSHAKSALEKIVHAADPRYKVVISEQ